MATALVPLAIQTLPSLIDLIAGLVHKKAPEVEQTMGSGTGPVKFAEVFQFVMEALNKAAVAGQIPKALPSDEEIKNIIQAVVSSLKLRGVLAVPQVVQPVVIETSNTSSSSLSATSPSSSITLASGQTLLITVR